MSKSLGNFFTIREVLDQYNEETVRYFMISSHYRSPVNYSEESLKEAGVRLERLYTALKGLNLNGVKAAKATEFETRFFEVMDDDFNTPQALAVLFDLVRHTNTLRAEDESTALPFAALLVRLGGVLGILQGDAETFLKSGSEVDEAWIESMIQQRADAKKAKNFAESDRIRDELAAQGIILQDSREGTTWRIER